MQFREAEGRYRLRSAISDGRQRVICWLSGNVSYCFLCPNSSCSSISSFCIVSPTCMSLVVFDVNFQRFNQTCPCYLGRLFGPVSWCADPDPGGLTTVQRFCKSLGDFLTDIPDGPRGPTLSVVHQFYSRITPSAVV